MFPEAEPLKKWPEMPVLVKSRVKMANMRFESYFGQSVSVKIAKKYFELLLVHWPRYWPLSPNGPGGTILGL